MPPRASHPPSSVLASRAPAERRGSLLGRLAFGGWRGVAARAPVGTGKFWVLGPPRPLPPKASASPRAPRLAAAATAGTQLPPNRGVTGARYKTPAPQNAPPVQLPFPPARPLVALLRPPRTRVPCRLGAAGEGAAAS
ncbi:hypothetical protein BS78_02G057400, partial [Paspalum vaginatum]